MKSWTCIKRLKFSKEKSNMAKFKKFLKVFLCVVLFLGLVALLTCYCVMPERTKEAIDIVVEYLNRPLPIIGVSLITLFVFIYTLYSKTSFGKKQINEAKEEVKELKSKVNSYKEVIAEYKDQNENYQNEVNIVVNGANERIDYLCEQMVAICDKIPNAKVNALGHEIQEQYADKKATTNEMVLNVRDNGVEQVKLLEKRIAELEEILNKVVNDYEERKETTND